MNDPLEILFQELTDTLEDSLPSAYWKHRRLRDRREDACWKPWTSGSAWRTTRSPNGTAPSSLERAVFLAAFQLPRALR